MRINTFFIFIIALLLVTYFFWRIRKVVKFCHGDVKKIRNIVLILLPAIILTIIILQYCTNFFEERTVIVAHILVISLVLDLLALIVRKTLKKYQNKKIYRIFNVSYLFELITALMVIAVVVYGFYNMNHIVETDYTITTTKDIQDYKVALISDTHYDTIQDTSLLAEKAKEISEMNVDLVVLAGDIVEENTSKESMEEVFQVLGGIQSKYGTYYVYGNHDRQPYTTTRTFTDEELDGAMKNNGIHILLDSYEEIEDDLIIAGRDDAKWGNTSGRASAADILDGVDKNKFILMIDHQPIEAEKNEAAGVDLQLSGHTHAGQIWPAGLFSELSGALNYGEYEIGDCTVITTSGFTGWGYALRTQEHCEYCIINITSAAE